MKNKGLRGFYIGYMPTLITSGFFLLEIDLAFCMALALLNGLAISAGLGLLCAKIKELLKVMLINKAVLKIQFFILLSPLIINRIYYTSQSSNTLISSNSPCAMRSCQCLGPVMWALRPLLSMTTVTGPSTREPHGLGINGRAFAKSGLGVLNRRPVGGVAVPPAWLPSFGMWKTQKI